MIAQLNPPSKVKQSLSIDMRMVPNRWWSQKHNVFEGDQQGTSIELKSWFQLKANFEFDLNAYQIIHEWRSADRVLRCDGIDMCRATKRLLRRSFVIRFQELNFTFQPRSMLDRTFVLSNADDDVGWVSPRGFFQNQLAARLPSQLPFEVRVFTMWLAMSTKSSG